MSFDNRPSQRRDESSNPGSLAQRFWNNFSHTNTDDDQHSTFVAMIVICAVIIVILLIFITLIVGKSSHLFSPTTPAIPASSSEKASEEPSDEPSKKTETPRYTPEPIYSASGRPSSSQSAQPSPSTSTATPTPARDEHLKDDPNLANLPNPEDVVSVFDYEGHQAWCYSNGECYYYED